MKLNALYILYILLFASINIWKLPDYKENSVEAFKISLVYVLNVFPTFLDMTMGER